jgi:hypothetical protein
MIDADSKRDISNRGFEMEMERTRKWSGLGAETKLIGSVCSKVVNNQK